MMEAYRACFSAHQYRIGRYFRTTMTICPKALGNRSRVLILFCVTFAFSALPRARRHSFQAHIAVQRLKSLEKRGRARPRRSNDSDGSYQILSERGTYEILAGHWLVLSTSKNHGMARLDGSRLIIFEFVSGGKKSRITYRLKYQRPPGWVASWNTAPQHPRECFVRRSAMLTSRVSVQKLIVLRLSVVAVTYRYPRWSRDRRALRSKCLQGGTIPRDLCAIETVTSIGIFQAAVQDR